MDQKERRRADKLLADAGEERAKPFEWDQLEDDERAAWDSLSAEDAVDIILRYREIAAMYTRPPRRRAKKTTIRESPSPPEHWPGLWRAEMQRYGPLQKRALATVGRRHPSEPATLEGLSAPEKSAVLMLRLRRRMALEGLPEQGDGFVPAKGLGPFLEHLAALSVEEREMRRQPRALSYPVKNRAKAVVFYGGLHPLATIKRLASEIREGLFLEEAEAVGFLLSNRVPSPPWLSATIEKWRGTLVNGQQKTYITIEIRDPLLTTPEELRDFYRETREELFGQPACYRPWRQRLEQFVDAQRAEDKTITWATLHERWNVMHPNHTYGSWRSLRNSYHLKK